MAAHPLAAAAISIPGVGCPTDERGPAPARATYCGHDARGRRPARRLFAWLDDRARLADTLVVLTSDHGEQAGDHWLVQKLAWFDESYPCRSSWSTPGPRRTPPAARWSTR